MSKRVHLFQDTEEIHMMPLMNIVMLLIPFLLMSTDFLNTRVGVIETKVPTCGCGSGYRQGEAGRKPTPPINLSLLVHGDGFELLTRGRKLPASCDLFAVKEDSPDSPDSGGVLSEEDSGPTLFRKKGPKHDTPALTRCLAKMKSLFPHEVRLLLYGNDQVTYAEVVELMDASRETATKEELFPQVLLSAGVL